MRSVLRVVSVMLVVSCGTLRAEDKKDASAPKDVLVGFMTALVRGDAEGLRARAHVEGAEAKTVVGWLEDIAKAGAEVRKASAARFGEEGKKKIDALKPFTAEDIKGFVEKIEGDDTAVVHLGDPEGNEQLAMKKVDGVWKLNVAEIIKQEEWSPANISKLSTEGTKRLAELKQQIEKGEIASAEAVATTMMSAALGDGAEVENEVGL